MAIGDQSRRIAGPEDVVVKAGLAAVELAAAAGLRVIAAASTDEKLALAMRKGAQHGICYSDEDLAQRLDDLTAGEGVDVVYDPVGGDLYESAFRSLGRGGRYLIIGFAGGSVPQFPANRLLVKNRKAIGFALMYYRKRRPDLLGQSATALCELCESGQIDPYVGQIIELQAAGAAIDAYLERRVAGATVVRIEP